MNNNKGDVNNNIGGTPPAPPAAPAAGPGGYQPALWEKILVAVLAVAVVGTTLGIAAQKEEIPARNFALLRILLSAAMGVMGGVIPGFLHVTLSGYGALIRAGGGLALAVLTYFFTPYVVPNDSPKAADAPKASLTTGNPAAVAGPLPLARMENFDGDALVHLGGTHYRSGDVQRLFDREDKEVGTAYPVVSFDLSKPRPGVVKLDRTRVVWAPVDLRPVTLTGIHFDNFKPPLTFLTKLDRKKVWSSPRKVDSV